MYLFETLSCLHSSNCACSKCALFKIVTFDVYLYVEYVTVY